MDQDEVIEQTLFIATDVRVYRIPPRPAAGGYKSGEWRVGDEIFLGRLRLLAIGDEAEVRLEDVNTGELFALVPIRQGERHIVVESAIDSSRNFVIRVENPETKAHAFLGMGFETRDVAFDFNAALEDNERRLARLGVSLQSFESDFFVQEIGRAIGDVAGNRCIAQTGFQFATERGRND